MPTSRVEVAWAVPVNIEQLGPHLDAYTSLQPAFRMLHLCNRFGTGSEAFVTKLPMELVQHIEEYIFKDKQEELIPDWSRDFRCWQNLCEPVDHLTEAAILELYNDLHEDFEEDFEECPCGGGCHSREEVTKVTKDVRDFVAGLIEEDDWCPWGSEHRRRIQSWHKRVGSPTEASRGHFDALSTVLKKQFGLEAWVSHVQESRVLPWVVHMEENVAYTTKAYLRLPQAASVQHNFELHMVDGPWDNRRVPTEAGFATELSFPPPLSNKDAGRFIRALKALDIAVPPTQKVSDPTQDTEIVPRDTDAGDTNDAGMNSEVKPKLTLLIRNDDDEEW
ncbi:Versiconal hemiacetal acetate reductase [Cercospora beticola]|uniref:Versiconal hemiacetal acetate reductase n=1 Tax=Cercospora beticola TaxID=122368 RepID=A0A2G5HPA5_CERBT|nr:Versiconal hemiacetal acetate reductase [Cercospora beticola]PIA94381.1 Versiconal hemiacetal acetate reductase [Cercospora beticola]WPB04842.1 hypothetical protein RHO25_009489 [Cercospora beticola]CAK1364603.1 unnamed protein product [Cercospora beticola]